MTNNSEKGMKIVLIVVVEIVRKGDQKRGVWKIGSRATERALEKGERGGISKYKDLKFFFVYIIIT